jgi:hypothetical protein
MIDELAAELPQAGFKNFYRLKNDFSRWTMGKLKRCSQKITLIANNKSSRGAVIELLDISS